ncbi:thiol reductant ABC exporter subunit CydD [Nocardiopsis suaedae]|uniref:Thiol reductant ABC exporter subunit CydD n=1 Tax=Nocardiopsis suaedae TaxID=3018444 RepID=A0ABT4TWC1_9ACTN|nr:thiol reductant ABC exporter subunit CydD [Nocardiopsis suaedae]MDA2808520.1 thiol reductant ABC exporter subunit CydD [Nocardiopsis suaedae]
MRPLDPRLVRTADAVRVHLAVAVASGLLTTGMVLAQAWLLAYTIAGATRGAGLDALSWAITAVAAVAIARAALSYGAETAALRSAARAKSQLRRRLVAHVTGTGAEPGNGARAGSEDGPGDSPLPDGGTVRSSGGTVTAGTGTADAGEVATLATRGLDALDDYFARYLPQLVLAVLVPLAVLTVVAGADWISAVVIAVTLPLIPVFMALVGWHTQERTQRRWRRLHRLGGHFLDVVEGLPTLAVFRRTKAQARIIRRMTDEQRSSTMATLRIAFLSAFVLELLSTLAVALVAVEIGIRLMYGMLDYQTALLVLILAPEAYLPLREVGSRFHASMEGVAAAEQVFTELDKHAEGAPRAPEPSRDRTAELPEQGVGLRLEGVGLTYPGRDGPALTGVDLEVPAGRRILLAGPSGSGKSSLLSLLLRFIEPTEGRILAVPADGAGGLPLDRVDPAAWRSRLAWVPQHPYLFDDTVAGNIRLGAPDADDDAVRRAAELAEADAFVRELPEGYATPLGERGARLSAGQRQRVALARAFLRDAPVVLLDEPTAHLDPENAAAVRTAVARLLEGRTGVVVAHDTGWAAHVDETVPVRAGRLEREALR